MSKLDETEMLKLQLANQAIDLANARRDTLGAQLLAKYGEPGETTLNLGADGTVLRAPKLESVPAPAEGA